jgi:hypothetical protein
MGLHPQEIETWVAALARYDNNEFDDALAEFDKIADTSKILFNMGVIHATLGEHEKAVSLSMSAKNGQPWSQKYVHFFFAPVAAAC